MTLPKLQDSPSLTEQAYQTIRKAIVRLEFQPDEYISIQELSGQLGVSRTPVREALLRLEKDGLVSIVPYKGAIVSKVSIQDIEEVMELRILLESYAARKAARVLSSDELAQAEAILERAEKVFDEGRHIEAVNIGHFVHELILSKVSNDKFIRVLKQLDIYHERIRQHAIELRRRRSKESMVQHRHIFAALKNADPDEAEVAMAEHLSSLRDDVLSSLPMLVENSQ